ncbi:F-box/kelch-repeat protein skip11 [Phtheirospermum japonicum]|uniref:F-box/kelch-repeat protein skip11 n=1 Tax=Phtheirospermum japonicum TaxID=374723 RepID=A0A830BNX4_9LAMI|nr:F-box/kelch-repeat protein skip11 [Phtheirospermum japonicum]
MLQDRACLVSRDYPRTHEREPTNWPHMTTTYRLEYKRPLDDPNQEQEQQQQKPLARKLPKRSGPDPIIVSSDSNQRHSSDNSDSSSLISAIGRDNSISCLIKCSRSDYGSIASLNRSFRALVRTGELYRLRRQHNVVEHWVYFLCQLLEWEAFDPIGRRWMTLPRMNSNDCFVYADKESLAVGTDLLVFGRDLMAPVIYRYSLLTNTWTTGMSMNEPRCLFGSASLGEIAILAGGCDSQGNILSSAELYNSETGSWKTLPGMIKPRKMCSGVFMDGKFYVIGGSVGPTRSC